MEYFRTISLKLSYCLDYILFCGWMAIFGDKLEDRHKRSKCHKRNCKNCRVQRVVKSIKKAKFHVVLAISTISHKTLCKALMEARLRGVSVRIATPKKMLNARDLVIWQLWMYVHSVHHSEVPTIKCVFLDGKRIVLRLDVELLELLHDQLFKETLFSYYIWYFGYLWHGEYLEHNIPLAA